MSTIVTRASKGSALTWTEGDANITNLNNDKIEDIVEDTTPQLGGDLDVNGNKIVSTSNGNIALEPNGTGKVTSNKNIETTGDLKANELHSTWSSGDEGGQINLAQSATNSTLAGDTVTVDIWQNRFRIFEQGGDARGVYIDLTAAATGVGTNLLAGGGGGATTLDGLSDVNTSGVMNNHILKYNSTASEWQSSLLDVPTNLDSLTDVSVSTPTDGQVLKYNNSLSRWENGTISGSGITDIVQDTTPQLGGNLDVQANIITTSTTNGNIEITPNGSGDVYLNADTVRFGDANNPAVLTTNGTGNLGLSTNNGTNSGVIQIISGVNGNINLTPDGTGQTIVKNLEYNENVFSLGTTSGTITPDAANGNVQTITLNGNLTFSAFANPISGQTITLIINTNGTGRTLTSTMLFAGGSKTLSTTSTIDILTVSYIGATYYASLVKDYK